jgi:hypothetical protein
MLCVRNKNQLVLVIDLNDDRIQTKMQHIILCFLAAGYACHYEQYKQDRK